MQVCELEVSIRGRPIKAQILNQERSENFRSAALAKRRLSNVNWTVPIQNYTLESLNLHTYKQKTGRG